jgi:hypothetical protein
MASDKSDSAMEVDKKADKASNPKAAIEERFRKYVLRLGHSDTEF